MQDATNVYKILRPLIDELRSLVAGVASKGGGGAGTQYAFVLNAGGTAGANVYTTWAALYAAMSLIAGPKLVEVVGTEHMTAGGPYDLNEVEFVASDPDMAGGGSALVIDNGATIAPGTLHFNDGLLVSYVGTGPCMTSSPAVLTLIDVGRGAQLQASAAGAFLQGLGGTFGFVLLSNGATLGDGVNTVIFAAGGANVLVQASGRCVVADNSIGGPGSGLRYDDTTQPNPLSLPGVPAGHLQMSSNANFVAFAPGVPTNWGATPPTETAAALDALAAPNVAEQSNAAPLGPAASIDFTFAPAFTQKLSGYVRVSGQIGGTTGVLGSDVQLNLYRDFGLVGQFLMASYPTPSSSVTGTFGASIHWIDELPDLLAHTYTIEAVASGGGNVSAGVSAASGSANELP